MSFTPQCPRCGAVLDTGQRIHWPCVQARLWQVVRVPLLVLVILLGMGGGALWLGLGEDAPPQDDAVPDAVPDATPQNAPGQGVPTDPAASFPPPDGAAATATPTPAPSPTLPPLVRIAVVAGQLYDEPGVPGDIVLERGRVLQVQSLLTHEGTRYYAVSSDSFGGTRFVRVEDVLALP